MVFLFVFITGLLKTVLQITVIIKKVVNVQKYTNIHYSTKLKEHFDIMIFIERYPLKRCQGYVKLIASKVNCFLNINDLSEVQLCMSSNSWT